MGTMADMAMAAYILEAIYGFEASYGETPTDYRGTLSRLGDVALIEDGKAVTLGRQWVCPAPVLAADFMENREKAKRVALAFWGEATRGQPPPPWGWFGCAAVVEGGMVKVAYTIVPAGVTA